MTAAEAAAGRVSADLLVEGFEDSGLALLEDLGAAAAVGNCEVAIPCCWFAAAPAVAPTLLVAAEAIVIGSGAADISAARAESVREFAWQF